MRTCKKLNKQYTYANFARYVKKSIDNSNDFDETFGFMINRLHEMIDHHKFGPMNTKRTSYYLQACAKMAGWTQDEVEKALGDLYYPL